MIARLLPAYRSVFQLRDVQGFSTCETAAALGIIPTAVKSRLRHARLPAASQVAFPRTTFHGLIASTDHLL
jgi:DNA-directed RNA polymerase specialized sigma24 family protein